MSTVSACGPQCPSCEALVAAITDPVAILRRLPEKLFSRAVPNEGLPEAIFDDIHFNRVVFGPIDAAEPTLQYELARFLAREKDEFVWNWKRAEADQLALGIPTVVDGAVVGSCPRASGLDLDRLGEQFGVGRPRGMTDCCYWRLVYLLRFTPQGTVWQLLELCELYTGVRPKVIETPCKIGLSWPTGGGDSAFDERTDDPIPGGWALDTSGEAGFYWDGGMVGNTHIDDLTVDELDSVTSTLRLDWQTDDAPLAGDRTTSWWGEPGFASGTGLTLDEALDQAKVLGVFIETINRPDDGVAGCYGATQRGSDPGGFAWA